MKSPFEFGGTVSDNSFTNRTKERHRLYVNLTSGINTILISPRRWGKSSLVERATKDIVAKHPEIKVISIDLFSVNSEEEFLSLFARSVIKASASKASEWLDIAKDTFKKLVPKIVLNTDLGDISLEFDRSEIKKHKEEILNLPETIASSKGIKFIVCIDEFQNIVHYQDSDLIEKAMRSFWQRHKNVSYCLFGSKRHMISDIFNDSSRSFYKFGDIMFLAKIERSEWIFFIQERFKGTNKKISFENAELIASQMQDHSWYVQQMSHLTWLQCDKEVTKDIVEEAFEMVKNSQLPFFQQVIENMSNTQINLLKAVLQNEKQLTSVAVMTKYNLGTPNNIRKNIQILIQDDIVDKVGEEYKFLDPMFYHLLKQTFSA